MRVFWVRFSILLVLLFRPVFAAPAKFADIRQERAESADSVRQDMRRTLQRIKIAANAQSQTSTASNDAATTSITGDPRARRKLIMALEPRERREAIVFYQKLDRYKKLRSSGSGSRDGVTERRELAALHDELKHHVDLLEPNLTRTPTTIGRKRK